MTNSRNTSYSQSLTNFQPEHIKEFRDSAIDDGIAKLNFYSLESGDEEGANYLFDKLDIEIDHTNNGMPAGQYAQKLVNGMMSGSWGFEGHKGVCVKLNSPLKLNGKEVKYLSVFGKGNLQLFIPKVTFKIGIEIATNLEIRDKYIERFDVFPTDRSVEDTGFWDWVLILDKPLQIIVTEGAKKACSLISAGYLAIGLNGMWGWSSNVKAVDGEKADKYGNKLDDKGKAIKLIHPNLEPFLKKNVEIVWALDRDENLSNPDDHKKAIDGVKQSKELFKTHCSKLVSKISDTVWEKYKGVDDLIASEGVKAFDKAYKIKTEVKLKPQKEPKPASFGFSSSIETGLVAVALGEDGKELPDKDGKPKTELIGNHLIVIATLDNPDGNGSAFLLEFKTFKGTIGSWTMPREYMAGDGSLLIQELYKRKYSFVRDKKSMLLDYLSTLGGSIEQEYIITDSSGWVNKSFVLPHKTHGDENLRFREVAPSPDVITEVKGTLQGWKDNVAARCAGNSRLILGLGASFAAPLLPILDIESGGFHLVGGTSQGKTIILSVAASVTGIKDIPHWRTTSNGLESVATAFNHLCLPLDEIGQADPKDVGNIAYMLGNGQGKARMTKNLTNRKPKTWKLIFLSSGEVSLGNFMAQANVIQKGGQEVRLPDVPAIPEGSKHGCFETIHEAESGFQFASALEAAVIENRGTALDTFLSRLVIDIADPSSAGNLSKQLHLTAAKLSEGTKDSAIGRVAKRFALVQVALGLAHKYDLLPFDAEQIGWAISECFNAWLASRGGDGSIEMKQAIKRIERLFVTNEISDRIDDLRDGDDSKVRNLLAHRKCDADGDTTEFWVPPSVFEKEMCEGVNKTELIGELQKMGWLLTSTDGRPTVERQKNKKKSRYFIFIAWMS
jgi:putative DNA primase/helicase